MHFCVARRQQQRGQAALQRLLAELIHDGDFLLEAMEDYKKLCEREPWAPQGATNVDEELWSFRALLAFRMVLYKLIMDLHEEKLLEKQMLVHLSNCHLY